MNKGLQQSLLCIILRSGDQVIIPLNIKILLHSIRREKSLKMKLCGETVTVGCYLYTRGDAGDGKYSLAHHDRHLPRPGLAYELYDQHTVYVLQTHGH